MKVFLTRHINVRTPSGLVPLAKLKEGDTVISFDGNNICTDEVIFVGVAAVRPKVDSIGCDDDKMTVESRDDITIGKDMQELDDQQLNTIKKSSVRSWSQVDYDDIVFEVKTRRYNTLFVGDKGKILVNV